MARNKLLPRSVVPRTLRGRLIAGLIALLTIACATVGLVTYLTVQRALSDGLNSDLQTATQLAYTCWEGLDDGKDHDGSAAPGQGAQAGDPDDGPGGSGLSAGASVNGGQDAHPDGSTPGPGSASGSPAASPSASPSATAPANNAGSGSLVNCLGLGERTFVARVFHGQWESDLVGDRPITLTAAEQQVLSDLPATPANEATDGNVPTTTRYLSWLHGTFELTAIHDPDRDGSIYYTGLPLDSQHDILRDVALAEAAVFAAVLVFAGVAGFFWVRFSLRPLRRVAATASRVAELHLETGEVSLPGGVPDTDPATETGQVGLAFNRMLGHVENALRRRAASEARLRRFAADASHELRTPLAAIRGYAELALLRRGDAPEEVTHALGRVLSESTRMSVLVDDLLLLARLDAGRPLSREPVDLTRLAIDATSDAQVARPSHRWMLELPDDPELVLGDEHRLRQVLGNLLSNAWRHTPDGTTVTVRVSGALPDGEPGHGPGSVAHGTLPPAPRVAVSVTDDGPGIPGDLLPDLFERFTRADTSRSHATSASSTGLGLAIVDAVVAAHHGAVLVTTRPGLTRFTLVLARPAGPPAPPA